MTAPDPAPCDAFREDARAYLDGEGDPCLEADLDFEGGITRESFREFVKTFRISVRSFAKYVRD